MSKERKIKSLLNDWISEQAGTQDVIAKKLKVNYGQLMAWLARGFVPKIAINQISKRTGIPAKDLIAEYNYRRAR